MQDNLQDMNKDENNKIYEVKTILKFRKYAKFVKYKI